MALGKRRFRPPALTTGVYQRRYEHGRVDNRRHFRSASRARRMRCGGTRVSDAALRSRTPCSHAATEGHDAMRSNSPRKNSCIDWRWSAASASRTSSGTFLIVICTGMTALCQHQTPSTTTITPPHPPENHLPLTTPAPPPVVLADAGTHPHPPHRARPREDGDDNPSFVPAPFRSSRAPSRCPRGCGDPSPSPRRAYPHEDEGGNPPPYPHLPVQITNPTLFSRPLPPCPEDSVHQSISP